MAADFPEIVGMMAAELGKNFDTKRPFAEFYPVSTATFKDAPTLIRQVDGLIRFRLYTMIEAWITKLQVRYKGQNPKIAKENLEKDIEFLKERGTISWKHLLQQNKNKIEGQVLHWIFKEPVEVTETLYNVVNFVSLVDLVVMSMNNETRVKKFFKTPPAVEKEAVEEAEKENPKLEPLPEPPKLAEIAPIVAEHGTDAPDAIEATARAIEDPVAESAGVPKAEKGKAGNTYAFTWWALSKADFKRVNDGHYYPRFRGDFKAGFTEIPNKEVQRFLMGADENLGKFKGRVDGRFLGWMGMTDKGYLQGEKQGRLVPSFVLAENEVVALGVAHFNRVDILRLKLRGPRGMKDFDWGMMTWKWDAWDPSEGGDDAPGKINVRVLLWDNGTDDENDARSYLEKLNGMSLDFEDVVANPKAFIGNDFKTLFTLPDAGVKIDVSAFNEEKQPLGSLETDSKGNVSFINMPAGIKAEFIAGKGELNGIRLSDGKYAPKAPLLHEWDGQGAEINPETSMKRRHIITVRKKDATKHVLIIVQKKEAPVRGDPVILVQPFTQEKTHKKPLEGQYGSKLDRVFNGRLEGNELSFHTIKKANSKPIENGSFFYYLFLARKEGKTYSRVKPENVPASLATIVFKSHKTEVNPGLYHSIKRGTKGKYWTTGAGNEVINPAFTPQIEPGVYRLYCVAVKSEFTATWAVPMKLLQENPGNCAEFSSQIWDFNFIEFSYGTELTPEQEAHAEVKDFKEFKKVTERLSEEEENLHTLQWVNKPEYVLFVHFYEQARLLFKRRSLLRAMQPEDRKRLIHLLRIVAFVLVAKQEHLKAKNAKYVEKSLTELGSLIGDSGLRDVNKETASNYLKSINSASLKTELHWLIDKTQELLNG